MKTLFSTVFEKHRKNIPKLENMEMKNGTDVTEAAKKNRKKKKLRKWARASKIQTKRTALVVVGQRAWTT